MTMWSNEIVKDGEAILYGSRGSASLPTSRLGERDRVKKLQHAQNHCGGWLRAVIIDVGTEAGIRTKAKRYIADEHLHMKIECLNPDTGEFRVRSVSRSIS